MHSPVVQLKSGGYLVINQTEALVAIDVNSGRSTKERHIEETALKTNCEAADEVARQLRLRDLAGLIVIDFIDMEEARNNHTVERRVKEAMRFDRARIQLGKISAFGLLELSRQRLRPSLMETSFLPCPHCGGTGLVRSVESASMHLLRAIEEEGIHRRSSEITVTVHSSVAFYILNQKRRDLADIEARYGFQVFLNSDDSLVPPAHRMEKVRSEVPIEIPRAINADQPISEEIEEDEIEEPAEEIEEIETPAESTVVVGGGAAPAVAVETVPGGEDGEGTRRRRRRRRRRGRRDETLPAGETETAVEGESAADDGSEAIAAQAGAVEIIGEDIAEEGEDDGEETPIAVAEGEPAPRRRRRGKRGGRRRHRRADGQEVDAEGNLIIAVESSAQTTEDAASAETATVETAVAENTVAENTVAENTAVETPSAETAPLPERSGEEPATPPAAEPVSETTPPAKPKRSRKKAPAKAPLEAAPADATPSAAETAPAKPKRTRTPRKKAAAPVADEAATQVPPATPAAPADRPAAPAVAEAPEPAFVVESSDAAAPSPVATPNPPQEEAKPTEPAAPARKGWWNRFL